MATLKMFSCLSRSIFCKNYCYSCTNISMSTFDDFLERGCKKSTGSELQSLLVNCSVPSQDVSRVLHDPPQCPFSINGLGTLWSNKGSSGTTILSRSFRYSSEEQIILFCNFDFHLLTHIIPM